MSTFAGFYDSVDGSKNTVFESFFRPYAQAYFRHFKSAPKGERVSEGSEDGSVPDDGDLIDYVEAAETAEEFWELLRGGSANIFYLWSTSEPNRMDYLWHLLHQIQEMMCQLGVLGQQSSHLQASSRPSEKEPQDFYNLKRIRRLRSFCIQWRLLRRFSGGLILVWQLLGDDLVETGENTRKFGVSGIIVRFICFPMTKGW